MACQPFAFCLKSAVVSASKPGCALRRTISVQLDSLSQSTHGFFGALAGSRPEPPVRKKRNCAGSSIPSPPMILVHMMKAKSGLSFS